MAKKLVSSHFKVRVISLSVLPGIPLAGLLPWNHAGLPDLAVSALACSLALIFLFPVPYVKVSHSMTASVVGGSVYLSLACAGADMSVLMAAAALLPLAFIAFSSFRKFSQIRSLFNANSPQIAIEDYSRLFYFILFEFVLVLTCCLDGGWLWVSVVMLAPLLVLMHLRSYSGRSFLVSGRKEKIVSEIIKGNLKLSLKDQGLTDTRMRSLYESVLSYMERERPYLDEGFSMADLAMGVYSNKSYLSRTINLYSGENFRSFVNGYRIRHAVATIDADPHIKMMEVASRSGFSSAVSFTMAFKYVMHMTPSEYAREVQSRLISV